MKDSAGRMVYINSAFSKIYNLRAEDCRGKTNLDFMPRAVAEQLRANDRMVLESNCARQFTESLPDYAGNIRHWLTSKFPFRGRWGEVFLGGIALEITGMIPGPERPAGE